MVRFKAPIGIAGCYVARRRRVRALCVLALGLVLTLPGKAKADYIFTRYDVPGSTSTNPQYAGINDSGQIVGRYTDADGTSHGYLLSGIGGTLTTLDVPGATFNAAAGINASGQIVGTYDAVGYLRMGDGSYTNVTVPDASAIREGDIVQVDQDGNVVRVQ